VERTTIAGENEVLGENLPQRHLVPPQIPHDQVRFRTPDRSGGKPATNRLSYGAAHYIWLLVNRPAFAGFFLHEANKMKVISIEYFYIYRHKSFL
jgi:hypothetical protein